MKDAFARLYYRYEPFPDEACKLGVPYESESRLSGLNNEDPWQK
jgi:hypothetical protein